MSEKSRVASRSDVAHAGLENLHHFLPVLLRGMLPNWCFISTGRHIRLQKGAGFVDVFHLSLSFLIARRDGREKNIGYLHLASSISGNSFLSNSIHNGFIFFFTFIEIEIISWYVSESYFPRRGIALCSVWEDCVEHETLLWVKCLE